MTTERAPEELPGETYREVLQSLGGGVALIEAGSGLIAFENAQFFKWFPPPPDEIDSLSGRIPDLNFDRALSRLDAGRAYAFETKSADGTPLRVSLTTFTDREDRYLLEVQNVSKEMEIQYMLDSYSKLAETNASELEKEKERVERLLLNVMPRSVFEEMKEYGTATPQRFEEASILMLDFVGFTDMTIAQDPSAIISELNDIFSAFDRVTDMFDCERVKTIGDAYMAMCGIPIPNPAHATNIAKVALRFRRYLERRNQAHSQQWMARIGINSGPVIGSLVGVQKYVYDLFGPGVNLAARMEGASEPMQITLNEETARLLRNDFVLRERGEMEIKGFGTQCIYSLEAENPSRR